MQFVQKSNTYEPEQHVGGYFDGELKLLGQGRQIGTVKSRGTELAFISCRETLTPTLEEGFIPKDWLVFTVSGRETANSFIHGRHITSIETLSISAGGRAVRQFTSANSLSYTFGIKHRILRRDSRFEILGLAIPTSHEVLKVRDSLRSNVIEKLEQLFDSDLEDKEFHMELTDLATTLLSTTSLNASYEIDSNRTRIVARATETIRQADPRGLNPKYVAGQVFASVRTLEYAFQAVLAMTPKQYIDYYRINLLREKLIAAPQIPILQLADEVGLPHLGNLSRNYKKLYGETPSATKRRLAYL